MRAPLVVLALLCATAPLAAGDMQDDCGSGADAPYAHREGAILQAPVDCFATFTPRDERDGYRFQAPPGTTFTIEVTPTTPGQVAWFNLYSPEHGGGKPGAWQGMFRANVTVPSDEPGLWSFWLHVCATGSCANYGSGSYRLRIALQGDAFGTDEGEGTIALGLRGGPYLRELVGPETEGLDHDAIDLPRAPTTGREFLLVAWDDCSSCLVVDYETAEGARVSGYQHCGTRGSSTECFVPPGVARALVGAQAGADVAFSWKYWRP